MIRRLLVLAVLVAVGFVVYHNRRHIAAIAGLGSPELQIAGDWYPTQDGFKEDTVYTFAEELISRDGDVVGQYTFRGFNDIEVTIDRETNAYRVEFPDDATMEWYREVEEGRQLSRRWRR